MNSEKLNIKFLSITVAVLLLLVPVLQTIPMPLVAPAYADSMIPVSTSTTRSFSVPYLVLAGQPVSSLAESLTWYANGTTRISDSRGNSLTFVIPILSGVTFTLLQNSTTVDQRVVGPISQYDIYWNAVHNGNGVVQKYKFNIDGSSVNGTTLQFPIASLENLVSDKNELYATKATAADFVSQNQANFTTAGAVGINWADAIKQGYQVSYDQAHSTLDFAVGKSFSVDPTVVATGVPANSPASTDYYEGERRVVDIGGNLFAFYYNGSNIVYKGSTNGGSTWGASTLVGTGTGQIVSDGNRWAVGVTTVSGTQYVSIVYWVVSGSNTAIDSIRGSVSGGTISWGTPSAIIQLASPVGCSGGTCTAANMANDTAGNLFLTARWLNSTDSNYHHQEFKSTNGGSTFLPTNNSTAFGFGYRPEFVLARLAGGNMLLAGANYTSGNLAYSVYSSSNSSWHAFLSTTCAGMTANAVKQISADSNGTSPYVAYVTGNPGGMLKVARWFSTGLFNTCETADSTLTSDVLPSIAATPDGAVHVYTINGTKVYETDKVGSTWVAHTSPFGVTFNQPDELTASISYPAALWEENSATPYNLMFGLDSVPSIPTGLTATAVSSSQINLSWTAPADNGAAVTGYKIERSADGGSTWSTIVLNTGSTSTVYSDTGLAPSTTYTYRVSAINAVGTGSASSTASATTQATTGITLNSVQTTSGTVSTSPYAITLSNFNVGTGSNRLLLIGIEANNNGATGVTFGGTELTQAVSHFSNDDTEFWYLKNPSGTGDIVVTMGGATSVVVGAYSFFGANQTNPIPTALGVNGSSGNPTISLTTKYTNSWVLDSPAIYGGSTLSNPTCTKQWDIQVSSSTITGASSNKTVATPGSVACSWTNSVSSNGWDDSAVEVRAAGSTAPQTTTASTGILEPLYCDPDTATQLNTPCSFGTTACTGNAFCWQPLVDVRNSHPHVPLFAIINPADGPADKAYTGYQNGIKTLAQNGVIVLGYVDTCFSGLTSCTSTKSITQIKSAIDNYTNFYKSDGLEGIALDDFNQSKVTGCSDQVQCFQQITSYIHGNFTYSIGNPGTQISQSYYNNGTADKLDIYELTGDPSLATLGTNTYANGGGYLKGNFTMLSICQSLPNQADVGNRSNFVSLLFYTTDGCNNTNPWGSIPTTLSTLAGYLDNPSSTITIKSVDLSTLPIKGYFDEVWQNGSQLPSAYSPVMAYNGTVGVSYKFIPDNAGTCTFDYWQDNNTNHTPSRTIPMISAGQTFTAVYNGTCNH